jgi:hypothetical protein
MCGDESGDTPSVLRRALCSLRCSHAGFAFRLEQRGGGGAHSTGMRGWGGARRHHVQLTRTAGLLSAYHKRRQWQAAEEEGWQRWERGEDRVCPAVDGEAEVVRVF